MTTAVVVPVYRNATTLDELCRRIEDALDAELGEIVLIDDASPDDSLLVANSLAAGNPRIRVVERPANGGQHRTLVDGLAVATGDYIACLDADLQDPPESLRILIDVAHANPGMVIFGGRRGAYQPFGRRVTSRLFKRAIARATGVPADASTLVILPREIADAVVALDGPAPFLTAMIAATGARSMSVPVERDRASTPSNYSSLARMRSALRGLRWAWEARRSQAAHNQVQLDHYALRHSSSIQVRPTRYSGRQVDVAVDAAGLQPGERVLDVGCGLGRGTAWLLAHGLHVEGLDLSPALLAAFSQTRGLEHVPTHLGDISAPAPELLGRFDAACGFFVLHHVHDLVAALDGMRQTVRPGGRIVLVEPNGQCPLFYAQILTTSGMTFRVDGGLARMRRAVLADAALAAGLEDPRDQTFGLFPPALVNRPRSARTEQHLERLPGIAPIRAFRVLAATRPLDR